MTKRPFSTSFSYIQSIQGLRRLHEMTLTGEDESPEAEAVRDGLDGPWTRLSEVEQKRITGLSEDLYSISDPPEESVPPHPQVQRKLLEFYQAQKSGDWDKALELLRCWKKYLDPALLSFLRGAIWREAGDYETAVLFYRHAAQLDPSDVQFAVMYLSTLDKTDPVAADERARDILVNDEAYQPIVVMQAAYVLTKSMPRGATANYQSELHTLTQVLERTLGRLQSDQSTSPSAFEWTNVTGLLGFCYGQLGDFQKSLRLYNLGMAADPENEGLLVARGILRYGVEANAAQDFEQAIRSGSKMVWPYFFLAHHYLVNNVFEECRKMSEQALEFPASDEVRAYLNEWLAISETELGFPPERIRAKFEAAKRLAPDSDRIRRNLDGFENAIAQGCYHQRTWDKPNGSEVQAVGRGGYQPLPVAA
jgi:tetratricopeptide (TPR) repeat protein